MKFLIEKSFTIEGYAIIEAANEQEALEIGEELSVDDLTSYTEQSIETIINEYNE